MRITGRHRGQSASRNRRKLDTARGEAGGAAEMNLARVVAAFGNGPIIR